MTKADSMSPRTPPTPKPVSAPKAATRTAPRFRSRRDWLSNEPGAWAIVLMPTLSALFACGPTVTTCWLAVAWACCYCVQFSAARWFKSRFRTRYVRPALTYLGALGAIGMPFVVLHPGVLRWAPLYIALAAGSMLGAWMRREHSLWANACAVLASSAMPLVMQPYGAHATPAMQLNGDTLPSVHSWFPEGTFAQPALMLSLAYTAMLGGCRHLHGRIRREPLAWRGGRAAIGARCGHAARRPRAMRARQDDWNHRVHSEPAVLCADHLCRYLTYAA